MQPFRCRCGGWVLELSWSNVICAVKRLAVSKKAAVCFGRDHVRIHYDMNAVINKFQSSLWSIWIYHCSTFRSCQTLLRKWFRPIRTWVCPWIRAPQQNTRFIPPTRVTNTTQLQDQDRVRFGAFGQTFIAGAVRAASRRQKQTRPCDSESSRRSARLLGIDSGTGRSNPSTKGNYALQSSWSKCRKCGRLS